METKIFIDAILDALREKQEQYHELAEDHWSYQCSELTPCEWCEAIEVYKRLIDKP